MVSVKNNALKYGGIYEFKGANDDVTKLALVVSAEEHLSDTVVNIILLSDTVSHHGIQVEVDGILKLINTGKVTFTYRNQLSDNCIMRVPESVMNEVRKGISYQLGIGKSDITYKQLYENLVDKLLESNV